MNAFRVKAICLSLFNMRLRVLAILTILLCATSYAQTINLDIVAPTNAKLLNRISYSKVHANKQEAEAELERVLFVCYSSAYITASYDSIIRDSAQVHAYLNFGTKYNWAFLKNGNIDEGVLSELRFREKLYQQKPIHYKEIIALQEKLIVYYENHGYPFASVKLDSVNINDSTISAYLMLVKNKEVVIDSVLIKGSAIISPKFIHNYIGISPGDAYNEEKIKTLDTRIAELPFVLSKSPSSVRFSNTNNKLSLFLDKKQASQFDGIVGILPDNQTNKVVFTGDLHLKLHNVLAKGELVDVNWRRLQTETQDLKLNIIYPFLFNSPFGIDYNLKLYKRDTTFLTATNNIGVQYLLIGRNYIKLYYENKSSSLLSTNGLANLTSLPTYADVNNNTYGFGFNYEKLDYRINPRKGYTVQLNTGVGVKTIKKNANLNPVVYDSIQLKSTQYSGNIIASWFIPILNQSTLKIGVQSSYIAGKTVFQNEIFRIGGLKTLRGFDEESIFASSYVISTLEYRFLLEQNSYLYLFMDGAYYENNTLATYTSDTPIGFGAGISFETKAGIFSINYALGKQFSNPIDLRSGKIHFGVVNYF